MEFRNEVIIGIPVYRKEPNFYEMISFERNCKILKNHTFSLITFKGLDISFYVEKFSSFKIDYIITYFDKKYFESLNGYNNLLTNEIFYQKFSAYSFILICQLDAFVFADCLLKWCNKGYDYIGAPWLNTNWVNTKEINKKLPFFARNNVFFKFLKNKDGLVGNGGFSLRRIDSHINFSKKYGGGFRHLGFNEDVFWGKYVGSKENKFKIPLLKEALLFSIENDPKEAMKIINNELPFGCHAWFKIDFLFWKTVFINNKINIPEIK